MNTIKIELSLLPVETDEGTLQEIGTKVIIDDVEVYKGGYIEVFKFFGNVAKKGVNQSPWLANEKQTRSYFYNSKSRGTFTPFSCSCGVAECGGIWEGILTKHRSKTVEWRPRSQGGYKFLKSFYSFSKDNYYSEVVKAWLQVEKWLEEGVEIEEYDYGSSILMEEYFKGYLTWEEVTKAMKVLVANYSNK